MNRGEHPDLPNPIRLSTREDQERHDLLWIIGAIVVAVLSALLVVWLAAPSDGRPPAAPPEAFTTTTTVTTTVTTPVAPCHHEDCPPWPSLDY